MEPHQPYRPPASRGFARPGASGSSPITRGMIASLQKTRPWVILMGVVGMIGTGLILLAGLAVMVAGSLPGVAGTETMGPIAGTAIGGVYVALAFLYFFPSLFLLRYGGAIGRVGPQGNAAAFEEALTRQLSFWRFVGILTVTLIAVYLLMIAGIAVLAVIGVSQAG